MISQLCSIKHSSALDTNVSRNKPVDLSKLSSYEQTKKAYLVGKAYLVEGLPKHE